MATHRIQFSTEELVEITASLTQYTPISRDSYRLIYSIQDKLDKVIRAANMGLSVRGGAIKLAGKDSAMQHNALNDLDALPPIGLDKAPRVITSRYDELCYKAMDGTISPEETEELDNWKY